MAGIRVIIHDDRPTEEDASERADVRLSRADKKLFIKLGGTSWLRKMLNEARRSSRGEGE